MGGHRPSHPRWQAPIPGTLHARQPLASASPARGGSAGEERAWLRGQYQLTISAQGFQSQVFESVQVQTARNTSLTATLQVGGTTQSVTISAGEVPLVETDSSVLSSTRYAVFMTTSQMIIINYDL